ncbi:MAG TPA: hypothetical protein VLK33_21790 [Terriglobales bacterium]|nr:hypothetical protein [Terriglobales bacterium]
MKWTSVMMNAFLLGTSFLMFLSPATSQELVTSDTTWTVTDSNGNSLGNAQNVCLNATAPANCPTGATSYGYAGNAWTATLPAQGGTPTWIWAPGIKGSTSPAGHQVFTFQKNFYLCFDPNQDPNAATVSLAADDNAQVFINGNAMATATSTTWATATTINVPKNLLGKGLNTIAVTVTNAATPVDPNCTTDTYKCNPAGFVLTAKFPDQQSNWPQCTNPTGKVGDTQILSCTAPQVGSKLKACICTPIGNAIWITDNTCTTPPPTCTDNGTAFQVGQTESLPCDAPLTGSKSRQCGANGTWGNWNTGMCVPPPKTCTGSGGTIFQVGQTETFACPTGQTGSMPPSHTCQADGTWGSTSTGNCQLPTTCPGCKCGAQDSTPPQTALCPSGTSCQSKRSRVCSGWWIFSHCDYIQTVDWFCLP